MKKIIFIAVVTAFVCSCGTTKKTVVSQDSTYHGGLSKVTSTRKERPTEPCEALSWERDLAAVGTATSYSERVARNGAIRDARYELGRMMQVAVEGAAEDYLRNVSKNKKSTSETMSEEISSQFFAECVKNSKVIRTSVYDLADGQIQVYACVEVVAGFDVLDRAAEVVENVLSKDEELEVEFDKKKFKEDMKEGLREYKENNRK